jgi:uncharacterized membrane protein
MPDMQEEPKTSRKSPPSSETPFTSYDQQLVEETVEETEAALQDQTDTGRLEAFSDGVFAIAITLLVLNLKVPDPGALKGSLLNFLASQWPTYLSYIISFSFILIMWANHHYLFRYIKRTDQNFLLINGLLLLFVTIVPFPTSLLATYLDRPGGTLLVQSTDQHVAAAVYAATYFILALCFQLVWRYATKNRRLLDPTLPPHFGEEVWRRFRLGPLPYLLALVMAFINVPISLAINIALAAVFAWPKRPRKHESPTSASGMAG